MIVNMRLRAFFLLPVIFCLKMAKSISTYIIFMLLNATYSKAFDDIDLELENGAMGKILRAMVNQTKADTLNLPANSTSIRENITDTFSCDNRTYGYYADVDNDCQLFHVCLPTQTASGRAVMYKWSFICPNETVFNQEVLVCTRPLDAIECEDSPMYYYLNMEIGKEPNDTNSETEENENSNAENINKDTNQNEDTNKNKERVKPQRRRPANKKKQNLIVESLLKEVVKEDLRTEALMDKSIEVLDMYPAMGNVPKIEGVNNGTPLMVTEEDFENSRLFGERSLKTKNRKLKGGLFRFKADM